MKTQIISLQRTLTGRLVLAAFVSFTLSLLGAEVAPLFAQSVTTVSTHTTNELIVVSGVVREKGSRKLLEYVNVAVPGSQVGTITNSDGLFTLKVKKSNKPLFIEFSHLGYSTLRVALPDHNASEQTYLLSPKSVMLEEVIVAPRDARRIVELAVKRIAANYNDRSALHTAFYRETAQKRKKYISLSEAVTEIYKEPYSDGIWKDRVRVAKARKLVSPKQSDTLAVKLQGGPTLAVSMDVMKNPGVLLDAEYQLYYNYEVADYVVIDDRPHYAIRFSPRVKLEIPLYKGVFYIDVNSLTISRMEFSIDMSDKKQVVQHILRRRPAGLRFTPTNMSYLVTYRQQGERSYLNYLRTEIKFKCDWKRKLFATNYTLVSEMVMTDREDSPASHISSKESFRSTQILTDQAMDFYDENFWADYNIIEPTESLEYAVKRLKKSRSAVE